ncbi:MAG: hypothetical protein JRN12_01495 [Nitrososphaerota archaeon]|jgi:metal-responsive CopG/Arc/MetJ family transcriptional regulator|nr:hypothetical protein [Nitrososphaerota archaeon]
MVQVGGLRNRVRVGISFDSRVVGELDRHVEASVELAVTRSEIVNAVLEEYFEGNGSTELVWETVNKRRVKRRG